MLVSLETEASIRVDLFTTKLDLQHVICDFDQFFQLMGLPALLKGHQLIFLNLGYVLIRFCEIQNGYSRF